MLRGPLGNSKYKPKFSGHDTFPFRFAWLTKFVHYIEDGNIKKIETNYVLGFFGLIMQLGPIVNWGLNLNKKTIPVNTENFETNQKGIFAIGDICTYPGKLKLILSGFHEGALAARGCFKYARPNEKLRFEFTTTSKSVQSRLGVKTND